MNWIFWLNIAILCCYSQIFWHDKENTLLRHANKMVHQSFANVSIHMHNQFAYCVLMHGRCHVMPWLTRVWRCCTKLFHTFLLSATFYGNVTYKTWRPDYRTSTTHRQSCPQTIMPTDNHAHTNQRRGGRREAATLLTATILLRTPHYLADWTLSVPAIEKNESCPNTVTQLIRSRFTKNTHIYICVSIWHKSKG